MSTRNRTLGGFGLAVAALAALSVTACDPYIAANTAAPVVLGVSMTDTAYNEFVPPETSDKVLPLLDKGAALMRGLCR